MKKNSAIIWRELHRELNLKTTLLMYVFLIIFNCVKFKDYGIEQTIYNVSTGVLFISIFSSIINYTNIEVLLALPLEIYDFCMQKTIYIMMKVIFANVFMFIVELFLNFFLLKDNILSNIYCFIFTIIGVYAVSIFAESISLLFKKNYKFIIVGIASLLLYFLNYFIFMSNKVICTIFIVVGVIVLQYLSFLISQNIDKEKLIKRSI